MYSIGEGQQAGGSAAYLPVRTAGQTLQFLVDTGAAVTVLSSTVYKNMAADQRPALQPVGQDTHIEVADQKRVPIDGMVELSFETSGQRFRWRALVAPIVVDGLLGLDFLWAHDSA